MVDEVKKDDGKPAAMEAPPKEQPKEQPKETPQPPPVKEPLPPVQPPHVPPGVPPVVKTPPVAEPDPSPKVPTAAELRVVQLELSQHHIRLLMDQFKGMMPGMVYDAVIKELV